MANNLEGRVGKLEDRFDRHVTVIYEFIDELRLDHDESKKRIAQNEEQIRRLTDLQVRLVDTQSDTAKILRGMNGKLTDHEDRLTALGSAPAL